MLFYFYGSKCQFRMLAYNRGKCQSRVLAHIWRQMTLSCFRSVASACRAFWMPGNNFFIWMDVSWPVPWFWWTHSWLYILILYWIPTFSMVVVLMSKVAAQRPHPTLNASAPVKMANSVCLLCVSCPLPVVSPVLSLAVLFLYVNIALVITV